MRQLEIEGTEEGFISNSTNIAHSVSDKVKIGYWRTGPELRDM
jgi:hypothetical protein